MLLLLYCRKSRQKNKTSPLRPLGVPPRTPPRDTAATKRGDARQQQKAWHGAVRRGDVAVAYGGRDGCASGRDQTFGIIVFLLYVIFWKIKVLVVPLL